MIPFRILKGIAENPSHARGIGPEQWVYISRDFTFHSLQVLENPAPGPVDVRAIMENDVDE
jgi:hypothetical protein